MASSRIQQMRADVLERQNRYWGEEEQRCRGKKVALVEGDTDRTVLEAMLTANNPAWSTNAAVVVAGGRKQVIQHLGSAMFPASIGLVDRDVWTDDEVYTETTKPEVAGRLFVTAGWCLENTLLTVRVGGESPALDDEFERVRDEWVRAGAMWWTLQRTREAFNAWQEALRWTYGQPRDDLELRSGAELASSLERLIPEALRRASGLDVSTIGAAFEVRVDEVGSWPVDQQWRLGVRGKSAFSAVLVPWLNRQHPRGQRGSREWLIERARTLAPVPAAGLLALAGVPAPFDAILSSLL